MSGRVGPWRYAHRTYRAQWDPAAGFFALCAAAGFDPGHYRYTDELLDVLVVAGLVSIVSGGRRVLPDWVPLLNQRGRDELRALLQGLVSLDLLLDSERRLYMSSPVDSPVDREVIEALLAYARSAPHPRASRTGKRAQRAAQDPSGQRKGARQVGSSRKPTPVLR